MVIVAISLVSLILVVGLVIDGGRAYTARRQVGNATDAAALAGAEALFQHRYALATGTATSASAIQAAVTAKLTQNRAVQVTCNLLNAAGTSTGVCTDSTAAATASGVRVAGRFTEQTQFVRVKNGPTSYTAGSTSAAAIEPLIGTPAPFIICGASDSSWPILNPIVPGQPATINVANALAAGTQPVQASKVGTCGAGAAFKGKTHADEDLVIVGKDIKGQEGDGYEIVIRDQVAGTTPCPTNIDNSTPITLDCDMLLPIADSGYGNGKDKIFLHIAAFAIFHITGTGLTDPKYYGRFVAPSAVATGGVSAPGTECAVGTQVCVIKLTL